MKKVFFLLLALALTCTAIAQNRNEVTFFVNYHCTSCVRVIDRNLPHERGVTNYRINFEGRSIVVTYNPRRTNPANIRRALERWGFEVRNTHEEILRVPPRRCS